MAEASDNEDDAPMPDGPAPLEPELTDMRPAPASAPPMSNMGTAPVVRPGTVLRHPKLPPAPSQRLSVVSGVGCLLCPAHARVSTGSQTVTDKERVVFFFDSFIVAVAK